MGAKSEPGCMHNNARIKGHPFAKDTGVTHKKALTFILDKLYDEIL